MTKKVLLGGILAGIVLFAWGAISHMLLGLTDRGVKALPDEEPVIAVLDAHVKEHGFYLFPGFDRNLPKAEKEAAIKQFAARYRHGPRGILVFQPSGGNLGQLFARQFGINLLTGLIAALIVAMAAPALASFGRRVVFAMLLGVLASVFVDLPYWNWYMFPSDYILCVFVDRTLGFLAAGLVLGGMIKAKPH